MEKFVLISVAEHSFLLNSMCERQVAVESEQLPITEPQKVTPENTQSAEASEEISEKAIAVETKTKHPRKTKIKGVKKHKKHIKKTKTAIKPKKKTLWIPW